MKAISSNVQYDLGKHAAQIEANARDITEVRADVKAIRDNVDSIARIMGDINAVKKTLFWIAGISTALGSGVVNLLTFIWK